MPVSVLFSEPKIPQLSVRHLSTISTPVSVLFSEPKIPQLNVLMNIVVVVIRFSALQRAENSSMAHGIRADVMFPLSFSALQRAENSSI